MAFRYYPYVKELKQNGYTRTCGRMESAHYCNPQVVGSRDFMNKKENETTE